MKLVHWQLIGGLLHLVQQGGDWAGPQAVQSPPCCTKCNSPLINGPCRNHRMLYGPLLCGFNAPINPLITILKPRSRDHYTTIQWFIHWPLMGGLLRLVQWEEAWAGWGPAQSPTRCTKCNSHQRPVYQLHIIWCGTIIASRLQRVKGLTDRQRCVEVLRYLACVLVVSEAIRVLSLSISILLVAAISDDVRLDAEECQFLLERLQTFLHICSTPTSILDYCNVALLIRISICRKINK